MAHAEFDTISENDPLYEAYAKMFVHPLICQHTESFDNKQDKDTEVDNGITFGVDKVWEKYWQDNGEQIVLDTWVSKYSDYVDINFMTNSHSLQQENVSDGEIPEKELIIQHSELSKMLNDISISSEAPNSDSSNDWQLLWEQHYEEQYYLNHKIFSKIFNDLKLNLSSNNTHDVDFYSESYLYTNSSSESENEESKQMISLGLPVAFGNRKNRKRKKKLRDTEIRSNAERTGNCLDDDDTVPKSKMCTKDGGSQEICMNNEDSPAQTDREVVKENTEDNSTAIPLNIAVDKTMNKYWQKRFTLFSRFDEGIKLDKESWFSVTPEKVAKHLAERLKCDILVDAFCGSGGNTIQFANTCKRVIAIDIDPNKIEMAKHNAKVYGVNKKIDFIVADFMQIYKDLIADVIFLSPPWGGPKYSKRLSYDVEKELIPIPASELLIKSKKVAQNVAMYLPRNSNIQQLVQIAGKGNKVEIERNYLGHREIALTAIYGDLINF